MTIYKIWAGRILRDEENVKDYFEMDAEYLKSFCRDLDYDYEKVEQLQQEVLEYFNEGSEMSEEGKRLLTATFIGDGEWNEPLSSWVIFPFNLIGEVAEYKWHHRFFEVAREHGKPNMVNEPYYSTPGKFKGDIEVSSPNFSSLNPFNYTRSIALSTSVLSLEWTEYMMSELDIDYEEEKFKEAKKEVINHYNDGTELSEPTKDILHSAKKNDLEWLKATKEEFNVNSIVLSIAYRANEKFIENKL